jgi:hypothetical protein
MGEAKRRKRMEADFGKSKLKTEAGSPASGELQRQLGEQLELLRLVCYNFDEGHEVVAKHIAVSVRVLVHDTGASHSLLSQLGMKDIGYVDTAHPFDPDNLLSYFGLISIEMGPGGTRYIPPLDGRGTGRRLRFQAWWFAPVFAGQAVGPPTLGWLCHVET